MTVSVGNAALQIDSADCDIEPVFGDGLEGLTFNIKISASLAEVKGGFDPDELAAGLEDKVRALAEGVLELEKAPAAIFCIWAAHLRCATPCVCAARRKISRLSCPSWICAFASRRGSTAASILT